MPGSRIQDSGFRFQLPGLGLRNNSLTFSYQFDRKQSIVFGFAEWSSSLPPFSFTQKKKRYPVGYPFFLKTNPNFNTNAPPFEIRGCKVILGGAFSCQGGANWV